MNPCALRRKNIHRRVTNHYTPLATHLCGIQNQIHERRIGLQGHTLAIAANHHKVDCGEEFFYQFVRSRLKLIRGDGEFATLRRQLLHQLHDTLVGVSVEVDVVDIVINKIASRRRHIFRRTQLLGQGTLHKAHNAVANKRAVVSKRMGRQTTLAKHLIASRCKVAYGVEQRSVEVKYNEFILHPEAPF